MGYDILIPHYFFGKLLGGVRWIGRDLAQEAEYSVNISRFIITSFWTPAGGFALGLSHRIGMAIGCLFIYVAGC